MRKITILILCVLMCITNAVAFSGLGAGTEGNPYQIRTCSQLQEMKDDLDAYYELKQDIDCSATKYWNWNTDHYEGFYPVGNYVSPFSGSLDGKNYKIKNLYINRTYPGGNHYDYVGLFGDTISNSVSVKNIGLEKVDITGREFVGALSAKNDGTNIDKCWSSGIVRGHHHVGGLIGENEAVTISNCYSTCNIEGDGSSYSVGGLVGTLASGGINNSYAVGDITGSTFVVGGLVGSTSSATSTITNSFAAGPVSGSDESGGLGGVGGLVGFVGTGLTIYNSYWDVSRTTKENCTGLGNISGCNAVNEDGSETRYFYVVDNHPIVDWGFPPWIEDCNNSGYLTFRADVGCKVKADPNAPPGEGFNFGSGTVEDPYIIDDCVDLDYIRNDLDAHYALGYDIDCSETENDWVFEPIGNGATPFQGSLNGFWFKITNLHINKSGSDEVGLFGYLNNSQILRLGIEDSFIAGDDYVGCLAARAWEYSSITDTYVKCEINSYYGLNVGGLVGDLDHSNITRSYSKSVIDGAGQAGGLAGVAWYSRIDNCYSDSDLTLWHGGTLSDLGGLVAVLREHSVINNSYSAGTIKGTTINYAGGLVGYMAEESVIDKSYTATVITPYSTIDHMGGIVGVNMSGLGSPAYILNSYWDVCRTGQQNCTSEGNYSECHPINTDGGSQTNYFYNVGNLPISGWDSGVWDNICSPSNGFQVIKGLSGQSCTKIADGCLDVDTDYTNNIADNCPTTYNPDQSDLDNDYVGDVCDPCPEDPYDTCLFSTEYSAADTIGTSGGVISNSAQEVSISIPFGALGGGETSITMSKGEQAYGHTFFKLLPLLGRYDAEGVYEYTFTSADEVTFLSPVTITFSWDGYGLSEEQEQHIHIYWWDGFRWIVVTPESKDYNANTITVQVNHFSNYALSLDGYTRLDLWDSFEGDIADTGETITFYANYTNATEFIDEAECNITFDEPDFGPFTMDNNCNGACYYYYSRSFAGPGIHQWNVTCSKEGFATLETYDNVSVQSGGGEPVIPEFSATTIILAIIVIGLGMALIVVKKKKK